jgi:Na+-transporting methylmalonyl-CoA/oxaloacetate decarboxylase gamma subunit
LVDVVMICSSITLYLHGFGLIMTILVIIIGNIQGARQERTLLSENLRQ